MLDNYLGNDIKCGWCGGENTKIITCPIFHKTPLTTIEGFVRVKECNNCSSEGSILKYYDMILSPNEETGCLDIKLEPKSGEVFFGPLAGQNLKYKV